RKSIPRDGTLGTGLQPSDEPQEAPPPPTRWRNLLRRQPCDDARYAPAVKHWSVDQQMETTKWTGPPSADTTAPQPTSLWHTVRSTRNRDGSALAVARTPSAPMRLPRPPTARRSTTSGWEYRRRPAVSC